MNTRSNKSSTSNLFHQSSNSCPSLFTTTITRLLFLRFHSSWNKMEIIKNQYQNKSKSKKKFSNLFFPYPWNLLHPFLSCTYPAVSPFFLAVEEFFISLLPPFFLARSFKNSVILSDSNKTWKWVSSRESKQAYQSCQVVLRLIHLRVMQGHSKELRIYVWPLDLSLSRTTCRRDQNSEAR